MGISWAFSTWAVVAFAGPEVGCDLRELVQGRLQILNNFGGQDGGIGQIGRIAQAVIPEPEDVEVGFVALDQVFVGEAAEALGFAALVAIFGIVAADEVVQVGAGEGVGLQREVLVGAEVVDPERLGPWRFAGRLAVEEEDVGLDALGVEDAGGQPQQGMDIAIVQEAFADGFAGAALEENVVGHNDGGAAVDLQQAADVLEEVELLVAGGGPEVVAENAHGAPSPRRLPR